MLACSLPAWSPGAQGLLVIGSFPPILPAGPATPAPSLTLTSADGKTSKPLVATRKR